MYCILIRGIIIGIYFLTSSRQDPFKQNWRRGLGGEKLQISLEIILCLSSRR